MQPFRDHKYGGWWERKFDEEMKWPVLSRAMKGWDFRTYQLGREWKQNGLESSTSSVLALPLLGRRPPTSDAGITSAHSELGSSCFIIIFYSQRVGSLTDNKKHYNSNAYVNNAKLTWIINITEEEWNLSKTGRSWRLFRVVVDHFTLALFTVLVLIAPSHFEEVISYVLQASCYGQNSRLDSL